MMQDRRQRMEQKQPKKKSATDEEIEQLVAERLLINAIKRRQAQQNPPLLARNLLSQHTD